MPISSDMEDREVHFFVSLIDISSFGSLNAAKDVEDALSWWTRNSHRGFDEGNYSGDELTKFRAVKQALGHGSLHRQ